MERWVGKIAVVTGASAGIGEDVAQKLVEEGLQVVGLARRAEIVEQHSKTLEGKAGKLHAFKCDVSNQEDVKKAFEWIKTNIGPVSILINNAGICKKNSFIEGDPNIWKQVLDTNIFGTAICTQQALQQMKEAGIDGHIININSIAGHKIIDINNTSSCINMYGPSKYALTSYTETMRQELRNHGSKTKITSISPGMVVTDIIFDSNSTMTKERAKKLPHLMPEDVSDMVIVALSTKPHVQIHELIVKPIGEAF